MPNMFSEHCSWSTQYLSKLTYMNVFDCILHNVSASHHRIVFSGSRSSPQKGVVGFSFTVMAFAAICMDLLHIPLEY